jgi:predicted phosphoadenosine phosphosulfate sulfurtransferase
MIKKRLLSTNVLDATLDRIRWTFHTFPRVCVSFSGGKDSTAMLHLTAQEARRLNRKITILFIDWEAQFQSTIDHVSHLKYMYQDVTEHFLWVALPLTTINAVSQLQPEWVCWDDEDNQVRQPPKDALRDPTFFPFYQHAMTFENFVQDFATWFADGRPAAIMIGIRADESINRFRAIASNKKMRYADDIPWTSMTPSRHAWNIYPVYDWKVADIWTWFSRSGYSCNPLYSLMYQAGVPLRYMRICEPFGPEQRQGLWLYHALEPERWAVLCQRVKGAATGARYARERSRFYGRRELFKPENVNWEQYAKLLLDSMPEYTAEHYRNKIAIYLHWALNHNYPHGIPDEQKKDTGSKDIPSWRRICKVLLTNDYWCRALSFSPTRTSHYERYCERMKKKREEWNLLP